MLVAPGVLAQKTVVVPDLNGRLGEHVSEQPLVPLVFYLVAHQNSIRARFGFVRAGVGFVRTRLGIVRARFGFVCWEAEKDD